MSTALLLFLFRKKKKNEMGQKFMNKNKSSMRSTVVPESCPKHHGEHPNQIKHRVIERLYTDSLPLFFFFMSSVGLDEWMSVALGSMKILRCRETSALHSHYSYQNPIPESMLNAKVICLYPLSKWCGPHHADTQWQPWWSPLYILH